MLSALMSGSVAAVGDDAASEFAAGYLWGTKAEDKRPYIVGCFETDSDLNNILDQIMTDYSRGDVKAGDEGWEKASPKFKKAMEKCTEVSQEFKDLSDYSKNVSPDVIHARAQKYTAEINQIGGEMVSRWNTGVYFDAGMYDGEIAKYMGLVPNPYPDMVAADVRDSTAPAQFTAGWLYGISLQQVDLRDKILACYAKSDNLTNDYFDGMEAYEAGNQKKGDKKFADAEKYYGDAFHTCDKETIDALNEWKEKVDDLSNIKDWDKISARIYEANKDVLNSDIQLEFKWWDDAVYFNSGMYAGRFQKVFLDNAPKAIVDELLSLI